MAAPLSLSVVWSEDAGPVRPGRLDVDGAQLTLTGGSRHEPAHVAIPLAHLRAARLGRGMHERLGDRSTLLLELHDGRLFAVAAFAAIGVLSELSDLLRAAAVVAA